MASNFNCCMSNIIKPSGFLQPAAGFASKPPWLGFDSVGDCKRRRRELGGSTGGPTSQRPKSNDDNDERTHKKTLIPLRKDV